MVISLPVMAMRVHIFQQSLFQQISYVILPDSIHYGRISFDSTKNVIFVLPLSLV